MSKFNPRKGLYFTLVGLRGQPLGRYYEQFVREEREGIPPHTTDQLLVRLLQHCQRHVPYYAGAMRSLGDSFHADPVAYLQRMPILTKDIIRSRLQDLQSTDLQHRRWYYNTSGGSTGQPVRFIQDWDYAARSGAVKALYSKLVGREIGEPEVQLWGSQRDILGTESWRARLANRLTNTTLLSAYHMAAQDMHQFVHLLNTRRPKLIVAYAEAMYEMARFVERESLVVVPQAAIITSAGTLYPFMRETIERAFQCRVFDRYGSREVGDIACEAPEREGLWVAPWGNYVEIVDGEGHRVPDGTEGEILVTCLTNWAMPLVRYQIGDLGVLSSRKTTDQGAVTQVLERILGRVSDTFQTKEGALVYPAYFRHLLFFKDWIEAFQVVQEDYSRVVFRIKLRSDYGQAELDEIAAKTRLVMGDDCQVAFEFVDEIAASGSGKYRYTISEVRAP